MLAGPLGRATVVALAVVLLTGCSRDDPTLEEVLADVEADDADMGAATAVDDDGLGDDGPGDAERAAVEGGGAVEDVEVEADRSADVEVAGDGEGGGGDPFA